MVCTERVRLAREYCIVVDAFYRSVLALNDLGEVEFHPAHEITEMYRIAVELARDALNHHLVEHGC
jgi:hypothetical protein